MIMEGLVFIIYEVGRDNLQLLLCHVWKILNQGKSGCAMLPCWSIIPYGGKTSEFHFLESLYGFHVIHHWLSFGDTDFVRTLCLLLVSSIFPSGCLFRTCMIHPWHTHFLYKNWGPVQHPQSSPLFYMQFSLTHSIPTFCIQSSDTMSYP